jgi:uncharacterized protein YdhG (YjbR/CyaY superfamily)
VCFAAATRHCSLYPMSPEVTRVHVDDLEGFQTSMGTIRFTADKPLPSPVVRKIVKARIAELEQQQRPPRKRVPAKPR